MTVHSLKFLEGLLYVKFVWRTTQMMINLDRDNCGGLGVLGPGYIQDYAHSFWGKNSGTEVSIGCQDILLSKTPLKGAKSSVCMSSVNIIPA